MLGTCFLACLVIYILPSVFVLNKESVRIRYGFLTPTGSVGTDSYVQYSSDVPARA